MIGPVSRWPQSAPADEETPAADEETPAADEETPAADEDMPAARGNGTGPSVTNGSLALVNSGLFADASNFDLRYVPEYDRIGAIVGALRTLGLKVVLTSGSFDILHEGHSMYLEAARRFGDYLIVGVPSRRCRRRR